VAVIGETPEAEGEVNFLSEICSKVHYFPSYRGEIKFDPKVEVHKIKPLGVLGEQRVEGVAMPDGKLPVAGVFIIREVAPTEQLIPGLQIKEGSIVVNRMMETNIAGGFCSRGLHRQALPDWKGCWRRAHPLPSAQCVTSTKKRNKGRCYYIIKQIVDRNGGQLELRELN